MMLVVALGVSSFFIANEFTKKVLLDYKLALMQANSLKANLLAKAGIQGAVGSIRKIPEEFLYKTGIAFNPPPIPLSGGRVYYRINPEDGKINLNSLIVKETGEVNKKVLEILTRLYLNMEFKKEKIGPLIDWIDNDDILYDDGAEKKYYQNLKPPRQIKNSFMYSLTEMMLVKGYDSKFIYTTSKDEDYDEKFSDDFKSEVEKAMQTDADFILSNNITAWLPKNYDSFDERINLNSAPYFVLLSLSDYMTKDIVKKVIELRIKNGGFIKDVKELEQIAEMQQELPNGITLLKEIIGENTKLSKGKLKTKTGIYKITGVGIFRNTTRRITALYEVSSRSFVYYLED